MGGNPLNNQYEYEIYVDAGIDADFEYMKANDVHLIPMKYSIDGEEFIMNRVPTDEELGYFYQKMKDGSITGTSQITPFTYEKVFGETVAAGKNILYIEEPLDGETHTRPVYGKVYEVSLIPTEQNDGTYRPLITQSLTGQSVNGYCMYVIAYERANKNIINVFSKYSYEQLSKKKQFKENDEQLKLGTTANKENFESFVFTKDGILILFPNYSIGAYYLGKFEVLISYDKIGF